MSEEPAAVVVGDLDAAEMRAADVRDAVVLREPLVDERVVRGQQIEHAAIFAEDAAGKELRFAAEALAQVLVEVLVASSDRAARSAGFSGTATARRSW